MLPLSLVNLLVTGAIVVARPLGEDERTPSDGARPPRRTRR